VTAARRFALAWGQAVHEASYVLMTRPEREAYFLDLTERLAAALTADPFDAYGGYRSVPTWPRPTRSPRRPSAAPSRCSAPGCSPISNCTGWSAATG
jgi:hypothetical protein